MNTTLALHLDPGTTQRLNFIEHAAYIPVNDIAAEAITLEKEATIRKIQIGISDIHEGRVISHLDLIADLESRIAALASVTP